MKANGGRFRTEKRKRFFTRPVVKLWNSLLLDGLKRGAEKFEEEEEEEERALDGP